MNSHSVAMGPTLSGAHSDIPWVPLGEGKAFKPLRFLSENRGFVELLRLEPGVEIGWHRHTGEVHALNLRGSRELHTGEIVGPGEYVYEPVGNTDKWQAVGDAPLIVLVIVMGAVEYLNAHGEVSASYTAETLRHLYQRYCEQQNIEVMDLTESSQ